jgi:hypothetical protein
VRIRHDDRRDPEGGHLGEGRRSGPPDDEIGAHEGRQHLVPEERVRPVARPLLRGQSLAGGEGGRVAVVAGDVEEMPALDEGRQGLGHGGVEAADRLGPTEDQHDRAVGRQVEARPRLVAADLAHVPDRGPRQVPRPPRPRQGDARLLVRDGDRGRQPCGQLDGPAGDDVAVPEDHRNPERRRRHHRRDGDVATGREDRGGPLPGEDRRRLRNRPGEPDRIEDRVDAHVDGAERAQRQAADADSRRVDEDRLEAAVSAEPDELRRVRSIAERARHGQGWVDVPARAAARDQ